MQSRRPSVIEGFQLCFTSIDMPAVLMDTEQRVIWTNAASNTRFGFDARCHGTLFADLFEDTSEKVCTVTPYNTLRREDGSRVFVTDTTWPLLDAQGQTTAWVSLLRPLKQDEQRHAIRDKLLRIATDDTLTAQNRISEILSLGCVHLQLPHAAVKILKSDGFSVIQTQKNQSDARHWDPKHDDHYCYHTLNARRTVAMHNVCPSAIEEQPDVPAQGPRAFVGAPVTIDGHQNATVSFGALAPRAPFTADDRDVAKMIADVIGHELTHDIAVTALIEETTRDSLTRAANRRCFLADLQKSYDASRENRRPVSLLLFDADQFDAVNHTHGQAEGDRVLRDLAAALRVAIGPGLRLYRTGGEEFAVILPNTNSGKARTMAELLRRRIAQSEFGSLGNDTRLTISVGLAELSSTARNEEDWMQAANNALKAAKAAGRNQTRDAFATEGALRATG